MSCGFPAGRYLLWWETGMYRALGGALGAWPCSSFAGTLVMGAYRTLVGALYRVSILVTWYAYFLACRVARLAIACYCNHQFRAGRTDLGVGLMVAYGYFSCFAAQC